ncbi:MAG TPA: sigma factor, partial [Gemmataceae bacterium]|nr:sigma factor [Gemmataceae bacterium]
MPPSGAPREPGTPGPDATGKPQAREDLETTARLLESVARGDERARNRLVRRYLPLMLRWAHGRLPRVARPLDDTQSLVLDTLQSALSHVEKFECRREGAFLAYLRTIFMNKLRDRCRGARPGGEQLW